MQRPDNPLAETTSNEQAPNEQAPLAPIAPYRSSALRARVAIWLLAFSTLMAGLVLVASVYGIGIVQQAVAGSLTPAEADDFVALSNVVGSASLLVFLVTGVAFLAWLSRAVDNVPALGAGQPSASPRWAIAWWFIPFANLGMPYEVVRELRARMLGDGLGGHPPLLLAWWFTFVGGLALEAGGTRVPGETLGQVSSAFMVEAGAAALTACAGVLAIFVMRGIERSAAARAAAALSGAPIPTSDSEGEDGPRERQTGWRMRASWVGYLAITASLAVGIAVPVLATTLDTSVGAFRRSTTPSATATDQNSAQAGAVPGDFPFSSFPHQAADLEAGLPESVAGQPLERWSVRGEDYFLTFGGLDADSLAQVEADLALDGLTIDDVAMAVGGRASDGAPPYFVYAFRFRGIAAATLPEDMALDYPGAGTFTTTIVGDKAVRRGTAAMIEQSEHVRGIPYLYDHGEVRYIIVTDDEAWAADALGQLD